MKKVDLRSFIFTRNKNILHNFQILLFYILGKQQVELIDGIDEGLFETENIFTSPLTSAGAMVEMIDAIGKKNKKA